MRKPRRLNERLFQISAALFLGEVMLHVLLQLFQNLDQRRNCYVTPAGPRCYGQGSTDLVDEALQLAMFTPNTFYIGGKNLLGHGVLSRSIELPRISQTRPSFQTRIRLTST